MQLNLNHFIKQIVTTLCLAVEAFCILSFSELSHQALSNCERGPPPLQQQIVKIPSKLKNFQIFILETKKNTVVCVSAF